MDIRDYLRALRRNWIAIILMTAVGLGVAYGWAKVQTPVYEASVSGLVKSRETPTDPQQQLAQSTDVYARAKVPTYLVMAGWRTVGVDAATTLGLSDRPEDLVKRITVTNPENTNIINIAATASSPKAAQQLADAWMKGLVSVIDETDGIDQKPGTSPVMIYVAQTAALPESPIFPSVPTALLIGGLLGLGGGIAFAMVRAVSDRRVRGTDDVEQRLGVPVVGSIPKVDSVVAERRIVADDDEARADSRIDFAVREALRALRTNLQFMDVDHPPRTIVVSSALPAEGKSTVAANLAMTLAAAGTNVVLVDGDLRRPTVASTLGLVSGAGLTDVLAGRAKLSDVAQTAPDIPNLAVLTAGTIPPNPSEVLGSERMHQLVKDLTKHATVIIDAPPVLAVTDAAVLTNQADGVLLVVAVGKTTYDVMDKALNTLEKARGRVLGVVLNRMPVAGRKANYAYDYREHAAAATKKSAGKKGAGKKRSGGDKPAEPGSDGAGSDGAASGGVAGAGAAAGAAASAGASEGGPRRTGAASAAIAPLAETVPVVPAIGDPVPVVPAVGEPVPTDGEPEESAGAGPTAEAAVVETAAPPKPRRATARSAAAAAARVDGTADLSISADAEGGDLEALLGDFIADDAGGGPRRQRGRS